MNSLEFIDYLRNSTLTELYICLVKYRNNYNGVVSEQEVWVNFQLLREISE